jgi:F-type H+-transporting ATPase subunit epsilon
VLTVSVISPEAVLFEGTTDSVIAPAFDGEVGILTGHAPMMTLLGQGDLRLGTGGGGGQRFRVQGGFLQVVDDKVRVVSTPRSSEAAAGSCTEGRPIGAPLGRWEGREAPHPFAQGPRQISLLPANGTRLASPGHEAPFGSAMQ